MAGVDIGGDGGGRRKLLDSEINMIPMIDLLMVTISFLLITAVWTQMARVNTDAQVPGPPSSEPTPPEAEKQLHVLMQSDDKFILAWKQGATTVESVEVPRRDAIVQAGAIETVRFPDLAAKVESEWQAQGQHVNPADRRLDQAVLHTDNKIEFKIIVGVIDAIYATHRAMAMSSKTGQPEKVPAFNVTFAVN